MSRALTVKNIRDAKPKKFHFEGKWKEAFGTPKIGGIWLIYGKEKNGKTTFALMLAKYMQQFGRVLYLSAEEDPTDDGFVAAVDRAGLDNRDRVYFKPYMNFESICKEISGRNAYPIIFIDNLTVYKDEVRSGRPFALSKAFPETTFIYLAHEGEKEEPKYAIAANCKVAAKRIVWVSGLVAQMSGRGGSKGNLIISEDGASLCYREVVDTLAAPVIITKVSNVL